MTTEKGTLGQKWGCSQSSIAASLDSLKSLNSQTLKSNLTFPTFKIFNHFSKQFDRPESLSGLVQVKIFCSENYFEHVQSLQ